MKKKILYLTLSKQPFEVMVTGEKRDEYRKPTNWIKSRLFNKDGTRKEYDEIRFTNGYGKDRPYFVCKFKRFGHVLEGSQTFRYSNGLEIRVSEESFVIHCGRITERGNLKSNTYFLCNCSGKIPTIVEDKSGINYCVQCGFERELLKPIK